MQLRQPPPPCGYPHGWLLTPPLARSCGAGAQDAACHQHDHNVGRDKEVAAEVVHQGAEQPPAAVEVRSQALAQVAGGCVWQGTCEERPVGEGGGSCCSLLTAHALVRRVAWGGVEGQQALLPPVPGRSPVKGREGQQLLPPPVPRAHTPRRAWRGTGLPTPRARGARQRPHPGGARAGSCWLTHLLRPFPGAHSAGAWTRRPCQTQTQPCRF